MAMAFCTATAEAQTTLQRNDSLYFTREQIKFERVNANGDSIFSVAISPTQINQSISNVQSGLNAATESIKRQSTRLDSVIAVLTLGTQDTVGVLYAYVKIDTVRATSYQLKAIDAGKLIVFTAGCSINVNGFPKGAKVWLRPVVKCRLLGNYITKSSNKMQFIQAGGTAELTSEGNFVSATGDLSAN